MKEVGLQPKVTNAKTFEKQTPDSEKIRIVRRITKAESDSEAVDNAPDIVIANQYCSAYFLLMLLRNEFYYIRFELLYQKIFYYF